MGSYLNGSAAAHSGPPRAYRFPSRSAQARVKCALRRRVGRVDVFVQKSSDCTCSIRGPWLIMTTILLLPPHRSDNPRSGLLERLRRSQAANKQVLKCCGDSLGTQSNMPEGCSWHSRPNAHGHGHGRATDT